MLFEKRIDTLRNPRNGLTFDRLVLESVDWVNVVALDAEGRSLMIRQFRFGVGYNTLETPGGMVDPGEDSRTAAARELLEETGYTSGQWQYLGAVEPNPAFHNHLCHHWLAKDVVLSKNQELGDGEAISIEFMTQTQVRDAVVSGELKHALALSALARVFPFGPCPLCRPKRQCQTCPLMIYLLKPISHSGRSVRFLALAGYSGLVAEIDALVQRSALQRAAAWREAGSELLLSINCSSVQIGSADFLPKFESMCAEAAAWRMSSD